MKSLLLALVLSASPVAVASGPSLEEIQAAIDPGEAEPLSEPPALAPPANEVELEALTSEVSKGLRCPVCQGLSVNDSPADGARTMKARIRELVSLGYSKEQIEDYFVDRYGTWVLLAPPATRQHWAVYLAPIAFLVVGGGMIAGLVRRRREEETSPSTVETTEEIARAAVDDELEPYRQRILAELGLQAEAS